MKQRREEEEDKRREEADKREVEQEAQRVKDAKRKEEQVRSPHPAATQQCSGVLRVCVRFFIAFSIMNGCHLQPTVYLLYVHTQATNITAATSH